MENVKEKIDFIDMGALLNICGKNDENLRHMEKIASVAIMARGNQIFISGKNARLVERAKLLFEKLQGIAKKGVIISKNDIQRAFDLFIDDQNVALEDFFVNGIYLPYRSNPVVPRGVAQKQYIEAISRSPLTFAIGPAGTGKTYLAIAMAVYYLSEHIVNKMILVRPAVEAGEKLGFLPGSMLEKINPYLRPLYDALHDMMEIDRVNQLLEEGNIEVAPLAFMRGRTLNNCFAILDEGQNTTPEQMKMFLTRLGFNTRTVLTGDITQVDLPNNQQSGLIHAISILKKVSQIKFCYFSEKDVVRHPLVQKIIKAYATGEEDSR